MADVTGKFVQLRQNTAGLQVGQSWESRLAADGNGDPWYSRNGSAYLPIGTGWPSVDCAFKYQTLAIARDRARLYAAGLFAAPGRNIDQQRAMAAGMFGRATGSDLDDANFTTAAGFGFANPAAQDTGFSGGVYLLNNAVIGLNNKLPLITHPHGEAWFARVRVRFPGTTFSGSGTEIISLVNAANTHGIQFLNNGTTTQISLFLFDAAGNSGFLTTGSDGVLGGPNLPNNAWTTVSLFFLPGIGIGWEMSDVVNSANFLSQANMDHLFDEPAVVLTASVDPMQMRVDAFAIAYQEAL